MLWDPFEEFRRIQEEMNRLFYTVGRLPSRELAVRTPVADIKETEKNVIVTFELPGVDKKDIELNVTEDSVEVRVQKKHEAEKKTKHEYKYEARAYAFYRKLALPVPVVSEKAEASYKDGLLRIEIPKKVAKIEGSKRIQIK